MHNMSNIVTSLPLDVEDLCDTLKVIFVGANIPNRVELRRICGVSRKKIRDALLWLKCHNYMYRMIPSKFQIITFQTLQPVFLVNEVNLDKLPEDDVPESIWSTIETLENVADCDAERTGVSRDPLSDDIALSETNVTGIFPISAR